MNRNKILGEIEDTSPMLSELKSKLDYDIPKDYFNKFPDKIWQQVDSKPSPEKSMIRILSYAAVAASLALLLYVNYPNQDRTEDTQSSVYFEYVMDNLDEYDEAYLIEMGLTEVDYSTLPLQLSEEDLDQYLIEED